MKELLKRDRHLQTKDKAKMAVANGAEIAKRNAKEEAQSVAEESSKTLAMNNKALDDADNAEEETEDGS